MKKAIGALLLTSALVLAAWKTLRPSSPGREADATVSARRGAVVRKAIAVGRVTVEHEVPVKSTTGGILSKRFVELGQKVARGTPVAEVRPVITSRNFVEVERSLQLAKDGEASAEEYLRGRHPAAVLTRWLNGPENLVRMKRQAELNRQQAEEQLHLLQQGKTEAEGRTIDYNVLAPVDGHVLEIVTREGAPVVSASSFGSGTVLLVMADMDRMLFLGTVDEIDVGRLREGMTAKIRVGALPDKTLTGTVTEIALNSKEVNNASVFDVRIALDADPSLTLRSGYSAVAEIEVDRRDNVVVLPERAVRFAGEDAFVLMKGPAGAPVDAPVQLGLSDGLIVEVTEGLAEGDEVFERD